MGGADVQLHSFLTLALEGCEWSTSCPTHFTTGKEARYPLNRRLGRTKGWCGLLEKRKPSFPCWNLHSIT